MEFAPVRIVEISFSPGHMWITAPDDDVAWFVRETVSAAGVAYAHARQGGKVVPQIVDLSTGATARTACEALAEMGIEFRWHMDQDPAKGEEWHHELPGIA